MDFILGLLQRSFGQVLLSLLHNWPFLLASILIAAVLKLFVDARKVSAFLARHRGAGVGVATAAAVGTPLCSCGTTAVVLGMLASTMPWGPIVAFMVASPLSSPEGMIYTAGLFGWPFAVAMFAASIALGLTGGAVATLLEKRGLLDGQARFVAPAPRRAIVPIPLGADVTAAPTCGCSAPKPAPVSSCGCAAAQPKPASRLAQLPKELLGTGGRLLAMFVGFAFIGFLLNGLIPAAWVSALFGAGKVYGVPLAATIGLPLYLSSEASLPMVRALLDSGMSQGAVMAFLIAGSGTSIGAIAGALTIAKWRVVGLVVGMLWIGAMAAGFAWNFLLALGLGA
jgi:uncharacterized membrane protein YraQ (UPF0718 family)